MSLKHLSSPYGKIKKIERIEKKQFPSPATERAIPTDGDIKQNKLKLKADDLTENIYTIKSIFDITHGSNTPEIPSVVPIPLQSDTLLFSRDDNVTRAGGYNNLDIRANRQDGLRIGAGNSREPYVVKPMAESGKNTIKIGYDRDFLPLGATLDDLQRFGKFYTSGKGLISLLKENVTNALIGDNEFFTLPPNPLAGIMAPPVPVPNTGFLNFYQQKIQGAGLGSIRKPFKIEYSTKASQGFPFAVLGDSTFGVAALEKIVIPKGTNFVTRQVEKGLRKLKKIALSKLEGAAQLPVIGKQTSFIGTGASKPVDEISRSPVEGGEVDDLFKKGDFYVRIKDLRGQSDEDHKLLYFRGFVNGINENVTPTFNATQYIGRSEDVYVYQKAERDLSFNLKVYPQNETEFNSQYEKIDRLTSLAYPNYLDEFDPMTGIKSSMRMQAPFTELYMGHIGSRAKGQFGFIKSLTYTVPEGGDWDAYSALPRMFEIAISYQILNRRPPQLGTRFYKSHGEYIG